MWFIHTKEGRKDICLLFSTAPDNKNITWLTVRWHAVAASVQSERKTLLGKRYCTVTLLSSLIFGEFKDARQNTSCLTSLSHEYDQTSSDLRFKKADMTNGLVASPLVCEGLHRTALAGMVWHGMPLSHPNSLERRLKKFIQELSSYNFSHAYNYMDSYKYYQVDLGKKKLRYHKSRFKVEMI